MKRNLVCWKELLTEAMEENNEAWNDIVSNTMSEEEMRRPFDSWPSSGREGIPFTVWTHNSVYFPVTYDGREWVERVARNPDGKPTEHIGG